MSNSPGRKTPSRASLPGGLTMGEFWLYNTDKALYNLGRYSAHTAFKQGCLNCATRAVKWSFVFCSFIRMTALIRQTKYFADTCERKETRVHLLVSYWPHQYRTSLSMFASVKRLNSPDMKVIILDERRNYIPRRTKIDSPSGVSISCWRATQSWVLYLN